MIQTKQTKNHSPASTAKSSEATQKAARSAASARQLPAWTSAWGNGLPAGLVPDLQAKLVVNEPGDVYEQEADHVADQVMDTAVSGPSMLATPPNHPGVSPALTALTVQLSPAPPMIQRAAFGDDTPTTVSTPTLDTATTESVPTSDVSIAEPAPENAVSEGTSTPSLIVDDSVDQLAPEQMKKSDFLAQLRDAVCTTTEQALAGTIWSAAGCPWVDHWFDYYRNRDSQQIERAIRRYAPDAANVTAASDYIPIICERVRRAIIVWSTTGEITGVPEGMDIPGGSLMGVASSVVSGIANVGSSIATGVESIASGIASGASSVVSGMGSALSSIGNLLFKGREGGAREVNNPQTIQSQLGAGRSLDGGVRSQMESAFGVDFSHVHIHTDATAAGLSESLNARAFTLGQDVAFGPGEYKPGTLVGDALIAHELAHVVQQGGANASEPMQKGGAEYNSLEEDADVSAVGAVVSMRGGSKGMLANIAQNTAPRLKSGLGLQRCAGTRPRVQGPLLRLTDFASMTPWQLARVPETEFSRASSAGMPMSGPGLADYARASRLARAFLTFDIDTPPGPGREPTEDELRILDQNLSQILSSNSIRALAGRPGRARLATQEGTSTPTLRGHFRIASPEAFAAGRYRLEMLVGGISQSSSELNNVLTRLWAPYHIPFSASAHVTDQERRMAVYYTFLMAPPIPNGFYQVGEDTIYIPDFVKLSSPEGSFLARHETVHLLGGAERTRQAFMRRFGADWERNWWFPFEEGVAELISIESLPAGQTPPAPPEIEIRPGLTVTGERYEQYVEWARLMAANREDKELILRAYFTGEVPERVFALFAQARGIPLPPPPR
jgi:hypothetical protein